MANGRCRLHGGKTPTGMALPQFKHGRYSKHMPARLLERYNEAANDPEYLEHRHDIALLDGRLADLLTRVDSGEAASLWEKARKLNQEIQKAVHDENYGRLMVHSAELDYIIGSGLQDYAAWSEIHAVLEQRRKLAESERKRLVEADQMVKADKALMLAMALLNAVKDEVTDRKTLAAIHSRFNSLINAEAVA